MKRYEMTLADFNGNKTTEYFNSRKQAYNFVMSNMLLQNNYQEARLLDNTTGEIWLDVYRGLDCYKFGRRRPRR